MKVIGISSSGRKNSYSTRLIQDIFSEVEGETELIRLAGKQINGCLGCLQCAKDNICVQQDDFQEVLQRVMDADALVFAGPNYYNSLNALGLAFWERTFCLRHQDRFLLAGKLAVAIGLDRTEKGAAYSHIEKMMKSNKMAIVDSISNPGNYQCYDCGFGHECIAGNVYARQGLCTKECAETNRPLEYNEDKEAVKKVKAIGKELNAILQARK
ncbi:flavodoxin family protein [Gottschalkiaceae bacterium SANA]|nr:flavodoxin family protein [Gottschalkiaceae bacterium SANA]